MTANILPPPDDFTLPIVKLLTHPVYRSYQSHTASLSLFANLFVNFLPPAWGAPTPPTPAPPPPESEEAKEANAERVASASEKEKNEWKRRIKMYSAYPHSLSSRFPFAPESCDADAHPPTVGHAVEAFGFQRILFGSSPAAPLSGASPASNAADWFEIARESIAELGVEQEDIDAVFVLNAQLVYAGAGTSS